MNDKLRLDYFLSVGGELAAGDDCRCKSTNRALTFKRIIPVGESYPGNYEFTGFGRVVYMKCELDGFTITSFAERENKGVQPVPDDFPVVATLRSRDERHWEAGALSWSIEAIGADQGDIITWKPDYEALLKMQAEHDKHNDSIIKACDEANKKECEMIYTQEMKDNGIHAVGMRYLNANGSKCTLIGISGSCFIGRLDTKHMAGLHKDYLSADQKAACKPLKTPEEIKLENAKKKQLEDMCFKYKNLPLEVAMQMQENGDLPEITISLKSEVKSRDVTPEAITFMVIHNHESYGWSRGKDEVLRIVKTINELGYLSIK